MNRRDLRAVVVLEVTFGLELTPDVGEHHRPRYLQARRDIRRAAVHRALRAQQDPVEVVDDCGEIALAALLASDVGHVGMPQMVTRGEFERVPLGLGVLLPAHPQQPTRLQQPGGLLAVLRVVALRGPGSDLAIPGPGTAGGQHVDHRLDVEVLRPQPQGLPVPRARPAVLAAAAAPAADRVLRARDSASRRPPIAYVQHPLPWPRGYHHGSRTGGESRRCGRWPQPLRKRINEPPETLVPHSGSLHATQQRRLRAWRRRCRYSRLDANMDLRVVRESVRRFSDRALGPLGVRLVSTHSLGRAGREWSHSKAPEIRHSFLEPLATYAPWREDGEFVSAVSLIKPYTMVDEYRLFELWSLARQVASLPGDILEVGSWRGGSGLLIACALKASDKRVVLVDTFQGVPAASAADTRFRGGELGDASPEDVRGLARRLDIATVEVVEGRYPRECRLPEGVSTLALVHLDVDIYTSALEVFHAVHPRLVVGGVLVFDDYGFYGCEGVTRFVNSIMDREDYRYIYNLNGHAVLVRVA